jgi:hypothetical protein
MPGSSWTCAACRRICIIGRRSIPAAVRALIHASRGHYRSIFVAYADCGTGGLLDAVLAEEGVERIPGAHCYEFFATAPGVRGARGSRDWHVLSHRLPAAAFRAAGHRGLGLDQAPGAFPDLLRQLPQARVPGAAAERGCNRAKRACPVCARIRDWSFESRATGYGTLEHGARPRRSKRDASAARGCRRAWRHCTWRR